MEAKKMITTVEATTAKRTSTTKKQALLSYRTPEVTVLGKVEHLTGALRHGTPDILGHGNIL
jgi:hypothetical protein